MATRLTVKETVELDGRTFDEICESVTFGTEHCPACCSEGCVVEDDGTCQHGFPSLFLAAGII